MVYTHYVDTYDVFTQQRLTTAYEEGSGESCVQWSPSGDVLAVANFNTGVNLYDAVSGERLHTIGHLKPCCLAWSPCGRTLAIGTSEEQILLWESKTRLVGKALAAPNWVRCMAWSPSGSCLAAGCDDGSIVLWDPRSGELLRAMMQEHGSWVWSLSWPGNVLASGSRQITWWDTKSGKVIDRIQAPASVCVSYLSPSDDTLACCSSTPCFWLMSGDLHRKVYYGAGLPLKRVIGVEWSPSGDMLASVTIQGYIGLWLVCK